MGIRIIGIVFVAVGSLGLGGCVEMAVTVATEAAAQVVVESTANAAVNASTKKGRGVVFNPSYSVKSPIFLAVIDCRESQLDAKPLSEKEAHRVRKSFFPHTDWESRFTIEEFAWRIQTGLEASGAEVTRIGTVPGQPVQPILENLESVDPAMVMIFTCNDLGLEIPRSLVGSTRYKLHWDVEVSVLDGSGNLIAYQHSADQELEWIYMEMFGWIGKAMDRYKEKFTLLYAYPDLREVIELEQEAEASL